MLSLLVVVAIAVVIIVLLSGMTGLTRISWRGERSSIKHYRATMGVISELPGRSEGTQITEGTGELGLEREDAAVRTAPPPPPPPPRSGRGERWRRWRQAAPVAPAEPDESVTVLASEGSDGGRSWLDPLAEVQHPSAEHQGEQSAPPSTPPQPAPASSVGESNPPAGWQVRSAAEDTGILWVGPISASPPPPEELESAAPLRAQDLGGLTRVGTRPGAGSPAAPQPPAEPRSAVAPEPQAEPGSTAAPRSEPDSGLSAPTPVIPAPGRSEPRRPVIPALAFRTSEPHIERVPTAAPEARSDLEPAAAATAVPAPVSPAATDDRLHSPARHLPLSLAGNKVGAIAAATVLGLAVGGTAAALALTSAPPKAAPHSRLAVTHHRSHPRHVPPPPTAPTTAPTTTVPPFVRAASADAAGATYNLPAGHVQVTISASGPCWIDVQPNATGPVLFEGMLQAGMSKTFAVAGSLRMRLGLPEHAHVTLGGRPVRIPVPRPTLPFNLNFGGAATT